MTPQLLVTVLVLAPLLGAVIAGLFGRRIGNNASQAVTTGLLFLACALAWTTFVSVIWGGWGRFTVELAPFINVGAFQSDWAIRIDSLSAVMLIVVTTVSALVHLYSWGYMADDDSRPRFFAYLSLFTFAMLALVTAADFMQLFFGWEGVGLASYLLIGFWYKKPTASAAAIKAFVVNRVGDFGFALGIMTTFWMFGTIRFAEIFPAVAAHANQTWFFAGHDWAALDLACALLFVGAMGKSAQFFLHTWLPDAMEGPTPVSALIHAATMVTAGVYMVCLLSPMFEYAPVARAIVIVIGAVTALFAATVGLAQNDIKRVIAYSTCSQLGYMFIAAGVGAYQGAMFHLFTHAFFKALLFLGAGSVIMGMHHEQDMRKMGALWKQDARHLCVMLIGTIAITGVGLPGVELGFAGFYSKDAIIDAAYAASAHSGAAYFAFLIGIVAAGLTSFYSWRLIFMTFHGHAKWGEGAHGHGDHGHDAHASDAHGHDDHGHTPHESPWVILVPLAAARGRRDLRRQAVRRAVRGRGPRRVLARGHLQRPGEPCAGDHAHPAGRCGLGAADGDRHRLRRRLVRLHRQGRPGRRHRRPQGAAMDLPLQQVVLRRALRRHLRARRQAAGRPVLEGRRPAGDRRSRPQRGGRGLGPHRPPRRQDADRLRLSLRLRHVARGRGAARLRPLRLVELRGMSA